MKLRLGYLLPLSGLVTLGFVNCNDEIKDLPIAYGARDDSGAAGTASKLWTPECKTACCPKEASCYVSGPQGPGAECLATRDNTGKDRIQLRQTWVYPTTPSGLLLGVIYQTLNVETQLAGCQTPTGTSGYIQLLDVDMKAGITRVGWAKFVPKAEVGSAISDGLCMVESPAGSQGWIDTATLDDGATPRALRNDQIAVNPNYPPGLLQAAAQPWFIKPTKARRVPLTQGDFDLSRDGADPKGATNKGALTATGKETRKKLLAATLEPQNKADGIDGFYYMDEKAGTVHGFATVAWQVIYNAPLFNNYIVVPIHEPETFQQVTNVDQRNCVGIYRAGQVPDALCAMGAPLKSENPWSGQDLKPGTSDAWTKGYFLISELEQIYVPLLSSTLCYQYAGDTNSDGVFNMIEDGFATDKNKSCRATGKWNALESNNAGLPQGDWCSETNGPATPNCHDAYLTIAYHTFAGANIKDGTCNP